MKGSWISDTREKLQFIESFLFVFAFPINTITVLGLLDFHLLLIFIPGTVQIKLSVCITLETKKI